MKRQSERWTPMAPYGASWGGLDSSTGPIIWAVCIAAVLIAAALPAFAYL